MYQEELGDCFIIDETYLHDPDKGVRNQHVPMDTILDSIHNDILWLENEDHATSFCQPGQSYCFEILEINVSQNLQYEVLFVLFRKQDRPYWTRHLYVTQLGCASYNTTYSNFYPSDNEDDQPEEYDSTA